MAYFPMFINLKKKNCLVVGGGQVALRKVRVLLDFGADIMVVAPEILPQIQELEAQGVRIVKRSFCEEDLVGCVLVVAATDDNVQNHKVAQLAKAQKIPVNAVDQKEDCTFIFPSYVRQDNLVGAFSSGGSSPVLTQYLKQELKTVLTPELGQMNEYMGSIRDKVKDCVDTERLRKTVYRKVLSILLEDEKLKLSEEQLNEIIAEVVQNRVDT